MYLERMDKPTKNCNLIILRKENDENWFIFFFIFIDYFIIYKIKKNNIIKLGAHVF